MRIIICLLAELILLDTLSYTQYFFEYVGIVSRLGGTRALTGLECEYVVVNFIFMFEAAVFLLSVCLSVCLCVSLSLSVLMSACLPAYLHNTYLPVCPSIHIYMFVWLVVNLSICSCLVSSRLSVYEIRNDVTSQKTSVFVSTPVTASRPVP